MCFLARSSRSRSRSRSHSPPHNREKKYQRGYQNNREFRGYHRGFRRPYNFRGRGRGFFPRGRYQRGGGNGGYNNNFRPKWKNYKQHPQKQYQQYQQQQQQQQQYNCSRGRCHNIQKRSGSPQRGHSHQSDRSSSPQSRHSQHSSASSHSSSPKSRPALLQVQQNSKDVKEDLSAPKEVQQGVGGDGEPAEHVGVSAAGDAAEGTGSGRSEGKWRSLTDCTSSPKRASPLANAAVTAAPSSQTAKQPSPSPKVNSDTGSGAPSWQTLSSSSMTKKTPHEGLNPMLSSFDFFSNEEYLNGDKTAISIAFGK